MSIICAVCSLNYYMFRPFYTEFEELFRSSANEIRQRMMNTNKEIEERFRDRIMRGEEPRDVLDFGKAWQEQLHKLRKLEKDKEDLNRHIIFLYSLLVFGLFFVVFALLYTRPVLVLFGEPVTLCTVGYVFTNAAGVLLILNQISFARLKGSLKENRAVVVEWDSPELESKDPHFYARLHLIPEMSDDSISYLSDICDSSENE